MDQCIKNEWCIENDFAAQRELAAIEEARWFSGIEKLRSQLAESEARAKALEEALTKLVSKHIKHFGLDGAWDEELNEAQRLLEATCQK